MRLLVLPGEGPHGRWVREDGILKAKSVRHGPNGFLIRYEPGDEYDFEVVVCSEDGPRKLIVGLPLAGSHFVVELTGDPRIARGIRLPSGRSVRIQSFVRKGSIRIDVDGIRVIDWRGDPGTLSLPKGLGSTEPGLPFVTLSKGEFRLTKLAIRATKGQACKKTAEWLLNAALRRAYEEQLRRER